MRRLRTLAGTALDRGSTLSRPTRVDLLKYFPLAIVLRGGGPPVKANATSFPIEETSIAALHAGYLSGRATAVSVCQAHLDRIAAYDRKGPALGAIIISNPKALADAAALDAVLASTGKLIGPLHGIPVLVKDNYDVAGLQTTVGSAALLGWVPEVDATVIAKISAAGGIILAKTTMSEWAGGWTILIPCSRALRAIPTTPPMQPADPRAVPGRGWQRASVSWAWVRIHSARSEIPAPTMPSLAYAQVGRWCPGPAWAGVMTSATPPARWPAPSRTLCTCLTLSPVSTRRTLPPRGPAVISRPVTRHS